MEPQTSDRESTLSDKPSVAVLSFDNLSNDPFGAGWLAMDRHVPLKMLPFDNKDELQVVVDLPEGRALEPTEAIRVLKNYGNPGVKVLCNTRPIHSIGVICGEQSYPPLTDLKKWITDLSESTWFIDTTDEALKLGNPIFGNIMAVGALAATRALPLERDEFERVLGKKMPLEKVTVNLKAYDLGWKMVA